MLIHFSYIVQFFSFTRSYTYAVLLYDNVQIQYISPFDFKDYETILGVHDDKHASDSQSSHPHTPEVMNGVFHSPQNIPDEIIVFKGTQSLQTESPMTSSPVEKKGMA